MRRFPAFLAAVLLLAAFAAGCETPTAEAPGETTAPMSTEMQSALAALPAGAQFVAAADVQSLGDAGFFEQKGEWQQHVPGEARARLQGFLDATGFDPQEDVQNVYVAKPRGQGTPPQMVVSADFDRARFEQQMEEEAGKRFETDAYHGQTLYRSTAGDHAFSFAFTDGGLILAAPRADDVRAMIDRLGGSGSALDGDAETMRLVEKVRGRGSAWFVARDFGQPVGRGQQTSAQGRRLGRLGQAVRSAAGTFSPSGQTMDGRMLLYAQDGADPADIQNVIEGLVATVKSRDSLSAAQRRAAESVRIDRSGDEVRVSFALDNLNGE